MRTTADDRVNLLRDLRDGGVLRRTLSCLTADNKHLKPSNIILSELIEAPIGTWGLSFFVTEDANNPIFLAVTELMLVARRFYIGSSVHYDRQGELKMKFESSVNDMSRWLHGFGYVGPVGVDVLETITTKINASASPGSVESSSSQTKTQIPSSRRKDSNFHIIDINCRTLGQLCLPLLRTHFTSRGLVCAASFPIRILKTREQFIDLFEGDFVTGKICILSWYDDPVSKVSVGNVVVGAEDPDRLGQYVQRIRKISQEISF
ncbi:hypothetical protein F5Y03DRAFT_403909 [Xylaria venustula]|nr:hypothetical protein F5Y03DRAFT_403909 [Xylaria venustula]